MDTVARPPMVTDDGVRCWACGKRWLLSVGPGTLWDCRCGARNEA